MTTLTQTVTVTLKIKKKRINVIINVVGLDNNTIKSSELLPEMYSLTGCLYLHDCVEIDDDLQFTSMNDPKKRARKSELLVPDGQFRSEREKKWFIVIEKDPKIKRMLQKVTVADDEHA